MNSLVALLFCIASDSHGFTTLIVTNIAEFNGSIHQIRGCQGVVYRWDRAVLAAAVTTTARIAIC